MTVTDLEARMAALIRGEIRKLAAYHVPDSAGLIKLDAMENPYRWPPAMVTDWQARLADVSLNRYPDPRAEALKASIRRVMDIDDGLEILLGNGSDEVIQLLALTVATPGATIMAPEPGFAMFRMIATFVGLNFVGVPLDDDFGLDAGAFVAAIAEYRPALIFLAMPNNPTGNLFDEAAVRRVVEAAPGLVVIDEAYSAFTDANHLGLIGQYDHVLVMRTLSKVGLAGLRLGMLIGRGEWLGQIDKLRLPYNIGTLTQASATFALENFDVLREQTRQIRAERERVAAALAQLPALTVWPSEANFLLFGAPAGSAGAVHRRLCERGVLVKNLDGSHPTLADCLRVTVSTAEENNAFLAALAAALAD